MISPCFESSLEITFYFILVIQVFAAVFALVSARNNRDYRTRVYNECLRGSRAAEFNFSIVVLHLRSVTIYKVGFGGKVPNIRQGSPLQRDDEG